MRLIKLGLVCIYIIFLTGCWDRVELEEMGYVVVVGVDKSKGNQYNVTYQIANPQVGTTKAAESPTEPASEIVTIMAPDIISAHDTANVSIARRISFAHTKILVVSEEVAKSEDFLKILTPLVRDTEMRRTVSLIVCKESASEFINNTTPRLETRPHKFYEFMTRRWEETGLVPIPSLNRFLARTEGRYGLFLGIYATTMEFNRGKVGNEDEYYPGEVSIKGGNPAQVIGSAVFKDGKMIGALTGEETRIALNLRPGAASTIMLSTFDDPLEKDTKITTRTNKSGKTKVKLDLSGERPILNVTLPLALEVISIQSFQDYVEDLDKQKLLKQHLEQAIEGKIKKLILKTQTEYKGDPFIWAEFARMKFQTYDEFQAYDWMSKYSQAEINIEVDVSLKGFGQQTHPPQIKQ